MFYENIFPFLQSVSHSPMFTDQHPSFSETGYPSISTSHGIYLANFGSSPENSSYSSYDHHFPPWHSAHC